MNLEAISKEITESNIQSLESQMLKHDQVECPVIHRFGPGTYMREVSMPAGAMVVGHYQNLEHTNIFLQGSMTLLMDGIVSEISAPMIFVAKPGRKIAKIHTDCVWINVYPNVENEQDIESLEAKFLTKSDTFKISEETKNALLIGTKDMVVADEPIAQLPFGASKIKTTRIGLFATANISENEEIGPVIIDGKMTKIGVSIKQSDSPNSKLVYNDYGNAKLVAIKKIFGCCGGFDGNEITIGGLKWQE